MASSIRWFEAHWQSLSLHDLYDLLQLRQIVFVKEQDCAFVDADGKDQEAIHLWARNEAGIMVACSRIADQGYLFPEATIGRVVTHESVRGTGVGRELMLRSIEAIYREYGRQPIRIGAQTYLLGFYGALGFVADGEEYLEDGILHVEMVFKQ